MTTSRFRGCLLGGAVGDALGAPVEFMTMAELRRQHGWSGVIGYLPCYGGIGKITDDTQMTLFTAEGLLLAWASDTPNYDREGALALLRWLYTQGEQNKNQISAFNPRVGLVEHQELHSRRAPGNTCLSALRAMDVLGVPARNDSKGCGTVMRMAPVGLFFWAAELPELAFRVGCSLSALTHGHPSGYLAGGAMAFLVTQLLDGVTLRDAAEVTLYELRKCAYHEEVSNSIALAISLADEGCPFHTAIDQLGEGWVAEEALAIGLYCALAAEDFTTGVMMAASHDGDTDSTASIAGNLLGIIHGADSIPDELLQPLELRDVITQMADQLLNCKLN